MPSWYIYNTIFEAVKLFHIIRFLSTTKFVDTKLPLPQPREHWNTKQYWGSADCGEVDLDSEVNGLTSDKI